MKNKTKKIIVIILITIVLVALGVALPIIVKGDNNTAQTSQVLSGKTFSTGSVVGLTGAMKDFSGQIPEVTATVEAADEDYIATIDLDDGYYESVKINAKPIYDSGVAAGTTTHNQTYTFAANDTGATKDLGVNHSYRYVNATNVYNKGKADGTITFTTQTKYTSTNNDAATAKTLTYTFAHKILGITNIRTEYNDGVNRYPEQYYIVRVSGANTVQYYGTCQNQNGGRISITCIGY